MSKILVYGAGYQARLVVVQRQLQNERIDAIIVTDPSQNPTDLAGVPVYPVDDFISVRDEVTVLIGVTERFIPEIMEILERKGFSKIELPCVKLMEKKYFPNVSDQDFLAAWYFVRTGEILDWNHLVTYNEKLQWIKLHTDMHMTELADKVRVRSWIQHIIGEQYLIPIYGVWNSIQEIDFSILPDSFVLKCNHGSGYNYIVKDKDRVDYQKLEDLFGRWMATDYSDEAGMELQYKNIERHVYAEEYLGNDSELLDYKFFVFHGMVRIIQVDINRFSNHERALFTPDWQPLSEGIQYPIGDSNKIAKPMMLDRMIGIAETLGKEFVHVRVDLYFIHEKIYFGEMTFTHGSGIETFSSKEFAEQMGGWIRLPEDKE